MNISVESSPNIIYNGMHMPSTASPAQEDLSNNNNNNNNSNTVIPTPQYRTTTASTPATNTSSINTITNTTQQQQQHQQQHLQQQQHSGEEEKYAVRLLVPKGNKYRATEFSSSSSSSSSISSSSGIDSSDASEKGFSPDDSGRARTLHQQQEQHQQQQQQHPQQQLYDDDTSTMTTTTSAINNNDNNMKNDPVQQHQAGTIADPATAAGAAAEAYMGLTSMRELPKNFKSCARDDLLILISRMLTHIISLNDEIDVISKQLTRFHSRAPPNISIYSYLSRLAHYSSLENAVLLTAIYYIDLLSSTYPVFSINSLTVHRFLLTATTVASKGLCDSFCSNTHYAKVGGVHISELNVLEAEFLTNVNWRIVPRDFTAAESEQRRDSSSSNTGTLYDDVFQKKKNRTGVASAEEVLDLYYRRMVSLFGPDLGNEDIPDSKIRFYLGQEKEVVTRPRLAETGSALKRSADHIGMTSTSIRGKRRNEK